MTIRRHCIKGLWQYCPTHHPSALPYPIMTLSKVHHKVQSLLWSKPPTDPAERKLLYKLDAVILTYTCLSYFSNYLGKHPRTGVDLRLTATDRANLANAVCICPCW